MGERQETNDGQMMDEEANRMDTREVHSTNSANSHTPKSWHWWSAEAAPHIVDKDPDFKPAALKSKEVSFPSGHID